MTTTLDADAAAGGERGRRERPPQAGQTARRLPAPAAQRRSPKGTPIDAFADERWNRPVAAGDVVPGVVVTAPASGPARIRVGPLSWPTWRATASPGRGARRRPSSSSRAISSTCGSIKIDDAAGDRRGRARADAASPKPRSSAIDNRSGQIRAMVGGWSFARSKFNRAVQAYRQLGSTFKPVVYTAAIDRGFTPASMIVDEPVSYPARSAVRRTTPAELRSQVRRARHAAPRARGLAQHSGGQDDGGARPEERASSTPSVSASPRTFRRICPSRSAPATAHCSRSRAPIRCFRTRACG